MDLVERGEEALRGGRWEEAREAFGEALAGAEHGGGDAAAWMGLAVARWWLGDNQGTVEACTRAYAGFRRAADRPGAVRCAVWLAITYKANFANRPAAEGWLRRADRLLEGRPAGTDHGWVAIARAYRMDDLATAAELSDTALTLAREADDVDLELVALAQLGRIRVAAGDTDGGFALLDEALAGALAGEPTSLDTVVYACCDMLNACDLATDAVRAAKWCTVADDFVELYGCPFLYAECRTLYGGVLVAQGRWDAAERELATAARITGEACPALHTQALVRLADLRLRQGRLEQAEQLLAELDARIDVEAESALTRAALRLARGDADDATRILTERLDRLARHRLHMATALATLVDAHLASGDVPAATATTAHLDQLAGTRDAGPDRVRGLAARARGRTAAARGETDEAAVELEAAVGVFTRLELPYETAVALVDLARTQAPTHHDRAVEHARRALQVFEQLGAARQADRAAALLRELGVHARTGRKNLGLLTKREQEVLALLGLGLSNPEIAGRLHVSRKTAAHHVSSILAKLHLRNRSEAAALAATATATATTTTTTGA